MSHPGLLPIEMQVLALAILLAFSFWVLWLIRNQRLHLRESLMWLLTTAAAMVVTAFPGVLAWGARLVGVQVPSNALFGAGLLYLAVNVLAITISVSRNTAQVRRLAQECALLRAELAAIRAAGTGSPEERPQQPPDERHRGARQAR